MKELLQFTAPAYRDRTANNVQVMRNLYPEKTATGSKLISMHGAYSFGAVANNLGSRGAYYSSTGQLFTVNGGVVYEVTSGGSSSSRGSLSATTGDVFFADNGTTLFIVQAGVNGYYMTLSAGSPTLIVDANFPTVPEGAAFIDGYFVTCKGSTGRFYLSQLYSGSLWTPVQFATAESMGDNLINVKNIGNQLWLFGERSIERWYDTGNGAFPFERITGAVYDVGLAAIASVAVLDNTCFFVASSQAGRNSIMSMSGAETKKISTPYIESLIASSYTPVWVGYCYRYDGHSFYCIDNRTTGGSYVYDIGEDAWLDRCASNTNYPIRRILNCFSNGGEPPYGFDALVGKVYAIQPNYNIDDNSFSSVRIRTFGPVGDGTERVFHSRIRFVFEATYDSTPSTTFTACSIDWTDNDGLSYATAVTPSVTITATTTGQLITIEARRLGMSAKRFYRLTISGVGARFIFQGCYLEAQQGPD